MLTPASLQEGAEGTAYGCSRSFATASLGHQMSHRCERGCPVLPCWFQLGLLRFPALPEAPLLPSDARVPALWEKWVKQGYWGVVTAQLTLKHPRSVPPRPTLPSPFPLLSREWRLWGRSAGEESFPPISIRARGSVLRVSSASFARMVPCAPGSNCVQGRASRNPTHLHPHPTPTGRLWKGEISQQVLSGRVPPCSLPPVIRLASLAFVGID